MKENSLNLMNNQHLHLLYWENWTLQLVKGCSPIVKRLKISQHLIRTNKNILYKQINIMNIVLKWHLNTGCAVNPVGASVYVSLTLKGSSLRIVMFSSLTSLNIVLYWNSSIYIFIYLLGKIYVITAAAATNGVEKNRHFSCCFTIQAVH